MSFNPNALHTTQSNTQTEPAAARQSCAWVFTINNPSSVDAPRVLADFAQWCIWQKEVGENGTPHLQGYVYFKGSRKLSTLRQFLPTAHFEIRRGTHEQAKAYSSKEDTRVEGPFEFGTEPVATGQGARSDLISLKRSLEADTPMEQIWSDHFPTMLKYYKGAHEFKRVRQMANPRTEKTVIYVIFGPTGTGKSHWARENFPNAYWPTKPPKGQTLWFDGYDGRSDIIFDEFYGWIPYDLLLRICDRNPLQLPTKGSHVGVNPGSIIFTSNKPPEQWYNYTQFSGGQEPFFRRIEYIIERRGRNENQIWKSPGKPITHVPVFEERQIQTLGTLFDELRISTDRYLREIGGISDRPGPDGLDARPMGEGQI